MFTSKEGQKTSSFNGASFVSRDLDRELIHGGSVDRLLRESTEQTDSRPLSGRFIGDLILTPEVLADFIGSYVDTFLRDGSLISGTSRLRDRLGEQVMAPCFSLRDLPRSPELASHNFLTSDGYLAQDQIIIDRGILRTFLLSLYGSRKTGKSRARADGISLIVDPGERPYEKMISSVERGIVLGRFSGGHPGESGEFSGVAKNSYYVEGGRVRFPITETMVSSNLIDLFQGITTVSAERVNYGSTVFPWVHCRGVTISGK
jgi:PmbA protein